MTHQADGRARRHEWSAIEADEPAPLTSHQLIRGQRMMVARFVLEEGFDMELPPFVPHAARALERTVVFDLFSPPSERTGIDRS